MTRAEKMGRQSAARRRNFKLRHYLIVSFFCVTARVGSEETKLASRTVNFRPVLRSTCRTGSHSVDTQRQAL